MSAWPLAIPGFTVTDRYDLSTSSNYLTTVTASSTIHTKGSWTELDASTSQDAHAIRVNVANTALSGTNTGVLLDIGIGAAGSETVLIANILAGWKSSDDYTFPIYLPAGTRVAARCQAIIVSDTVDVGVRLLGSPNSFNHDMRQGGNIVTYGADTVNSRGTLIPDISVVNVKDSWVEFTSSTTEPHSALMFTVAGGTDTGITARFFLVDIGFGAAGSEKVLIGDVFFSNSAQEAVYLVESDDAVLSIGRVIPVGTRLAMRMQATGGNVGPSFCLHGVT